jgi:predicted enzyme related to lactoylglutathione lyase
MSTRAVSALHIRTRDLARAKAFYESVLGIEFDVPNERVCNGRLGDLTVVIEEGPKQVFRAAVAFVVDDLGSVRSRAVEQGGTPGQEGYARNADAAIISDPDGNALEFVVLPSKD